MFSKELQELDRNTVQYMIDEMQDTIDEMSDTIGEMSNTIGEMSNTINLQENTIRNMEAKHQEELWALKSEYEKVIQQLEKG